MEQGQTGATACIVYKVESFPHPYPGFQTGLSLVDIMYVHRHPTREIHPPYSGLSIPQHF